MIWAKIIILFVSFILLVKYIPFFSQDASAFAFCALQMPIKWCYVHWRPYSPWSYSCSLLFFTVSEQFHET